MEEKLKKFILLNSPIFWDATTEKEQYLSPLGLGYIATYLEKAAVKVEILDCVKKQISVEETAEALQISKEKLYVGTEQTLDADELLKLCAYLRIRPENIPMD